MANINIGRVRPTFVGTWGALTQYRALNIVRHSGASWFALTDSLNQEPAEGSSFWSLMVSDGIRPNSNINYEEYTSTALRNAATNIAWRRGDLAAVSNRYFLYVGENLSSAAATQDSDWSVLGGSSNIEANEAVVDSNTEVLTDLSIGGTDYRVGIYLQDTAPSYNVYGTLWLRATDSVLFIYNGSAWVQIS